MRHHEPLAHAPQVGHPWSRCFKTVLTGNVIERLKKSLHLMFNQKTTLNEKILEGFLLNIRLNKFSTVETLLKTKTLLILLKKLNTLLDKCVF